MTDTLKSVVDAISTVGFPIVIALLLWYQQFKFSGALLAAEARETEILDAIRATLDVLSRTSGEPSRRSTPT